MTDYKYKKFVHSIDKNNNMCLVRYILAFGVLIDHFNYLCNAKIPWFVSSYDSVCGFFVISGFLLIFPVIKGKPIREFFINRAWRLLPSYLFVVLAGALLLVTISTLPPTQYFTSSSFWQYILANITTLNFLHPDLPGVFSDLKISAVNGSLWTIKIEWQLAVLLPIIFYFIKKYNLNFRKTIILIIILSLLYRIYLLYLYSITDKEIYSILGRQIIGQLVFFYLGVIFFTYYKKILQNLYKIILISTSIFIFFKLNYSTFYQQLIYPFILAILVISFSLIPKDFAKYIDRGHNISYEIYLCHFPILQVLAYYNAVERIGVAASLAIGVLLTIIAAIIVYFTVGNLYLKRKKKSTIPTVSVEQ